MEGFWSSFRIDGINHAHAVRERTGEMELTVNVKLNGIPTARQAARAAEKMAGYRATVLLRRGDMTVNAKSLLGLLSLQLEDGVGVTIIASGEDEAQAACTMAELLGA